jgi:hypothetical protein
LYAEPAGGDVTEITGGSDTCFSEQLRRKMQASIVMQSIAGHERKEIME